MEHDDVEGPDEVRPVTHQRVPPERLRLLGLDHLHPAEAARVLAKQDEIRAAQRAAEDDRRRRHAEAERAEAVRRGEEYARAGEERRAFIERPFDYSYATPAAAEPRPRFVVECWGGNLHRLVQDRLSRESAEDRAAEDDAAAAAQAGPAHDLVRRLESLERETRKALADAQAQLRRAQDAAAALLAAGEDPGDEEEAARDARALAGTLEARLPAIAGNLGPARDAAARRERDARKQAAAARKQARKAEQLARERAVQPKLHALLLELYGLEG